MDETFKKDTLQAVNNADLTQAMDRATRRQDDARKQIIQELGDPLAVRELAGACRDEALDRLDERLVQLVDNARASGVDVHFALDAHQACRIVGDIARRNACKLAIKTKSMMCEEIELNPFLERAGIEVVETDLGEYIIQLAGEPPSHIIGPACHKTAKDIAKLFHERLGIPYTEDAQTLAGSARGILREKFRQADMGITGANFAVADTGAIAIVTNEGNGRFVASRPRVLVTIMGMEKVISRTADLAVLLKVLGRSATGQRMSVYTNLTTGPRLPGDPDGPEQVHLVVVDNGRSKVLASKYRTLLRCIRCGACLNACPVYRKIGGHAYSSVYPGPIGKLLTPLLQSLAARDDLPQASALCDACRDACAVRIDLPEMLILMREDLRRLGKMPLTQQAGFALWARVMTHPALYRLAGRLGRFGLSIEAQDDWVARIPPAGNAWTDARDLPLPAPKPFHRLWEEGLQHATAPGTADAAGNAPNRLDGREAASTRRDHGDHPPAHGRRPHAEPVSSDPWAAPAGPTVTAPADEAECSQETFLALVRDALAAVEPMAHGPDHEAARLVDASADTVALFKQRLAELKVVVHQAATEDAVPATIAAAVEQIGATSVVATDEPILQTPSLKPLLASLDCRLIPLEPGNIVSPSFQADVGITGAELGIAETGTVVLASGGTRRRLVGIAPPAHIMVLRGDAIVADLLDWAAWHDRQPRAANWTFVTGPSKTADIELNLVTGMHAPGIVHLVLVG